MEKFIKDLVLGSGKILRAKFKSVGVKSTSKTDPLDLLTEADLASEKFIISQIRKKFPKHQIISEEFGDNKFKSDHTWVIDPLDGTLNFARGIPVFVSQVALIQKGEIIFSAVYDPMRDELFFAKKGGGAFCNGKRILCSKNEDLSSSLLSVNGSVNEPIIKMLSKINKHKKDSKLRVRNIGCIGLGSCDVAIGRVDYVINNSGKFWDYAPVYLILKESGCLVKNLKGKDWQFSDSSMVAGNKKVVQTALRVLNK
jgi:myo-inositol-1(or 4)-monophosphatase